MRARLLLLKDNEALLFLTKRMVLLAVHNTTVLRRLGHAYTNFARPRRQIRREQPV
jgi:hypothetical protein